jgi:hypothetical protein
MSLDEHTTRLRNFEGGSIEGEVEPSTWRARPRRNRVVDSLHFASGRMQRLGDVTKPRTTRVKIMKQNMRTAGLITLALGIGYLAGRETPVAAQGQGRVLEIRTYVTPDRTGLDNLVKRMKDESKIFDRLGMKSALYSVAIDAPQSENTFVYILSHESREKAKENWTRFGADTEWQQLRTTAASPGQIKVQSVFVSPTDFSPLK